jgi:predicted ATPase
VDVVDNAVRRPRRRVGASRIAIGRPGRSLVDILGPGGTGKTRLALEVAGRAQASFSDGVFFIPLISVSTAAGITERLVDALALKEQALVALVDQRVLIILDNFEHLSAHAGWVAEALGSWSRAVIVATSREALKLSNEWVLPIDGLSYPKGVVDVSAWVASMVALFNLWRRESGRSARSRYEGWSWRTPDGSTREAAVGSGVAGLPWRAAGPSR